MASPKVSKKRVRGSIPAALGAGIHAATIKLKEGASYGVSLLSGGRATATLARGVSPKLVDECLRSRRLVMLADGDSGPVILGALQTAPVPQIQDDTGAFEVVAKEIRLQADTKVVLRVGAASLALEKSGIARIEGEQMVIDVGALLRVLTTKVELP